jgi:hypothetical protein
MRTDGLDLSGAKLSISLFFCLKYYEYAQGSVNVSDGGVGKTKFKILPKVSGFTDAVGIQHLPGEVVELPESYRGETWLKPVEDKAEVLSPPSSAEAAIIAENPVEIHLEKKPRRKAKCGGVSS